MRRAIRAVTLSAAAVAVVLSSAAPHKSLAAVSAKGNYIWGMVTDSAGLGDKGFNDSTLAGLNKAKAKFGGVVRVVQSTEQAQYVPNLTELAQAHASLIVGVGFLLTDAVTQVAAQFPQTDFAIVDTVSKGSNVASYTFRQNEGSYLGGLIAGMLTKRKKVGFVGGIAIPPVVSWWAGYVAGIRTINPKIKVLSGYVGSFSDPAKGKETALAQYNAGADIVFDVSGQSGLGVYSAAKSLGPKAKVFSTDTCKYYLAPKNALPDVLKRVDNAAYSAAQSVVNGTFKGGEHSFGLKDGGIGLCQKTYGKLPAKVKAIVSKAKKLIIQGKLVPPSDAKTLKSFKPPHL